MNLIAVLYFLIMGVILARVARYIGTKIFKFINKILNK